MHEVDTVKPPGTDPLIHVADLTRHFGRGNNLVRAVDGVSFDIARGTCFGLLGPNGAGKTTTIELLEGITPPTSGTILYKGKPLSQDFREQAGIMFQNTAVPDFITTRETLKLFGNLYPTSIPSERLIEACSLSEFLDRDARKLSGGQRQRLLLAIALINDPEIVFLDEPTTGLDPQARRNFWQLIRDIRDQGKTIVLTTHYMDEAYSLCDEICIMDHGKIIAQGTPDALLSSHFNDAVIELPSSDLPEGFSTPSSHVLRSNGTAELVTNDVNATIRQLIEQDVPLGNMKIRQRTLEDLFIELTGKELRT